MIRRYFNQGNAGEVHSALDVGYYDANLVEFIIGGSRTVQLNKEQIFDLVRLVQRGKEKNLWEDRP